MCVFLQPSVKEEKNVAKYSCLRGLASEQDSADDFVPEVLNAFP